MLELILSVLPPGAAPVSGGSADLYFSVEEAFDSSSKVCRYCLFVDNECQFETYQFPELLLHLENRIDIAIAMHTKEFVFVDASVVWWRERAIIFPGNRVSGRWSLLGALVAAGADCHSERFAVFDHKGYIHAYPRPTWSNIAVAATEYTPLKRQARHPPVKVGTIALIEFDPRIRWLPNRISRGQGLLALLDAAVTSPTGRATAFDVLKRGIDQATVIQGLRRHLSPVLETLLEQGPLSQSV
ncbi:conserved hypothetical protein [Gammaproteobacteria bacterium]